MYLTQSLRRALQQTPDLPMTIFGDRTRTVRESGDRIARLAAALRGLGVGPGDRVAMLALNSDRFHEYLLGTWWAGAAVNPVNTRWSVAEIAFSLQDSDTAVLLVDDEFASMVPELRAHHPGLRTVVHAGDGPTPAGTESYEGLLGAHPPVEDALRSGDDLAGVFYTGGTTGHPKGVMLSHANIMTSVLGGQATSSNVIPGGRALVAAPMYHLAALAAWNGQLVAGGTLVIVPRFAPVPVLEAVTRERVTSMLLVPTMIQMLVDHPAREEHDLGGVARIQYGASPISEPLLERAMKAFPHAEFGQGYGMTEAAPTVTMLTPDDHADGTRLRSAGRPARHVEVAVVDPEGEQVPRGMVGEIVVRGGNVMLGYWNRPQETAEALRGGWLHTGDAGHLDDDGYLWVVDRLKDMIISGGENVYSAEVENALARHPAVAGCAVIAVPDDRFGERVHAVVVLEPGHHADADELRAHTKTLIAGYKAPRTVEFRDALPLSAAGKILKRELRDAHRRKTTKVH